MLSVHFDGSGVLWIPAFAGMTCWMMRYCMCKLVVTVMSLLLMAGCSSTGPRPGYYITSTEMQAVYGTYALSNGDTLRITRDHNRDWAVSNRLGRTEIVPVDSIGFVEKAGILRYTFTPLPFTTEVRIDGLAPPTAYAAVFGRASP
jgi:hypothetical protein